MAVLGIVLIVIAVLFGLGVSVSSVPSTTMEVFGVDFGMSVPTVFFLGAVAGAALMFGIWLTKKGLGRGYRRRKEMRELRAQTATTAPTPATQSDAAEVEPKSEDTRELTADERPAAARPAAEQPADERPADEQPAVERHVTTDPTDTKQPH